MSTIKAYTDLEQSKKLTEILPIESADMIYIMYHNGEKPQNGDANLSTVFESSEHKWYWIDIIDESWDIRIGEDIPCWSLAVLLNILKDKITFGGASDKEWFVSYTTKNPTKVLFIYKSNLVDACYELIVKLKKLNLL